MGVRGSVIGKTLKTTIEKFVTVTAEIWKGFTQDAKLYCAAGEDSVPVKGDQLLLIKIDGTGKFAALGVLDVSEGAKPGEKILYARDADGKIKSKLSMFDNGAVKLEAKNNFEGIIDGDFITSVKGKIGQNINGDYVIEVGGNYEKKAGGDIIEDAGGKFYIGNGGQNLCKVLIGLIDEIKKIETFGPPPKHKLMPDIMAALETYKEQVKMLLKEAK